MVVETGSKSHGVGRGYCRRRQPTAVMVEFFVAVAAGGDLVVSRRRAAVHVKLLDFIWRQNLDALEGVA